MKVTQARWGADSSVSCANSTYPGVVSLPLTSNAGSSQETDQIRKRCSKQQSCEVEASRSFFDEGAASFPSEAKYLKVWHECIPDVAGVILPTRRAKRDAKMKRKDFLSSDAVSELLNSNGSLDSNGGGVEPSFFGGKSNEQISSNGNESVAEKEKRSEEIRENVNLARMLDELLAPSTLNK